MSAVLAVVGLLDDLGAAVWAYLRAPSTIRPGWAWRFEGRFPRFGLLVAARLASGDYLTAAHREYGDEKQVKPHSVLNDCVQSLALAGGAITHLATDYLLSGCYAENQEKAHGCFLSKYTTELHDFHLKVGICAKGRMAALAEYLL